MKINESKGGTLHLTESVLKNAQQSVGFLKDNLNTLNTDEEQKEHEQPGRYIADPVEYLTRGKEEKFGGLPVKGKEPPRFSTESLETKGKVKKHKQPRAGNKASGSGKMPGITANRKAGITNKATGIVDRTAPNKMAGTADKATGISSSTVVNTAAGTAANTVVNTAADTAANTVVNTAADTAVNTAAGAAAGAATGGASIAAQSVKAAKDVLIAKKISAKQQIGQLQGKMETVRSENTSPVGIKQTLTYIGATTAVLFLAMLQMAASVMFGLIGILISIIEPFRKYL